MQVARIKPPAWIGIHLLMLIVVMFSSLTSSYQCRMAASFLAASCKKRSIRGYPYFSTPFAYYERTKSEFATSRIARAVGRTMEAASSVSRTQSVHNDGRRVLSSVVTVKATGTQETGANERSELTRTAISRMKVADLRQELENRGLDTTGTAKELRPRLRQSLEEELQKGTIKSESRSTIGGIDQEMAGESGAAPSELLEDGSSSELEEEVARRKEIDVYEGDAVDEGGLVDPDKYYVLRSKGASHRSSDGTGIGIWLYDDDDDENAWMPQKYLKGNRSVFEADYSALVLSLRYALRRGVKKVFVQLDNDTIVEQLRGNYQVSKASLKPMYWDVMHMKESMDEFYVQYIFPSENVAAKDLAGMALATGTSAHIDDSVDPMEAIFTKRRSKEEIAETEPAEREASDVGTTKAPTVNLSNTYLLQFDGGARRQLMEIGGAGLVLYDQAGREIWCGWHYIDGKTTNNVAEYKAILLGLRCAESLGIKKLRVEGDSELVIKQLKGMYKVKDEKLKKLYGPTKTAMGAFDSIEISHVPRAENKRADWLANHAMDTKSSFGFEEI